MSGFAGYPEYRDSGVEWIGDVPAGWEVKRLKNVLRKPMKNGLFKKKDQFGSGSLLVNVSDLYVEGYFIDSSDLGRVQTSESERIDYVVEAGDLFFVRSSLKLEGIGRAACFMEEEENVVFECHIVNARPNKLCVSAKFLTRYVNSLPVAGELVRRSKTTTMTTIDQGGLATINVLVPTKKEQVKIDHFLDYQIRHIDTLIEKQQQLIKLLKEKRQAVISHAVTKGLNPDAPMKDSGVEWLGEVPEHWEVKRLKGTSAVVDCRNKTPEYFEDGEYFVVRTTNVKAESISLKGALYTDTTNFEIWTQRGVPPVGSILFTREAPTGEICLVPIDLKLCLGQRMMNFICHDDNYTSFLFCFLLSDCLDRYIESVSLGSTVSHLRVEQVENIPVLVPPPNECDSIADLLTTENSRYFELQDRAFTSIDLLQERRTALISAAVTGKIDVRNWQPPVP